MNGNKVGYNRKCETELTEKVTMTEKLDYN